MLWLIKKLFLFKKAMYYIQEENGNYTIVKHETIRGPYNSADEAQKAIDLIIAMSNHIESSRAVKDLFNKQ
jgi:hypothetical protein